MSTETPQFGEERIPSTASRGATPAEAFLAVYDVESGDDVRLVVEAESGGEIPECDDRRETWLVDVESVDYDSRKNYHTVRGRATREGGDESGTAYVRHHTSKTPEKGLTFGSNSNGSPLRLDAPVDFLDDDRERTVVEVETTTP